jgi:hypothetical protein
MRRVAFLALSTTAAAPAVAEQPLLRPNRDVDVTYRAAGPQGGATLEQRVRWLAAAQTMRIDPPAPGLHVIIDYLARRMSVVREATHSVVEMAPPDSMAGTVGGLANQSFVRRGEATVAGHACTEWQTLDRGARPVLVCITGDGVLLRAGTPDQVRISAISVQYGRQDPSAFSVPPDYAHLVPGAAQ